MEGAVSAALTTAGRILADHGSAPPPAVETPPVYPRALLVLARLLLIPVVAVARIVAWVEEIVAPRRPEASEARRQAVPKLLQDRRPRRKR